MIYTFFYDVLEQLAFGIGNIPQEYEWLISLASIFFTILLVFMVIFIPIKLICKWVF